MRSPITPATGPAGPAPPTWPGSRAAGGISRNASSRPRTRPGSITTRSAPGGPGTPTSPCPCSPWPGWRPAGPRPKKRDRHQRPGHDRLHAAGDPPPADQPGPGLRTRPRERLVLVPLATTTPVPGPAMPLPATRLRAHLSAVAVRQEQVAYRDTPPLVPVKLCCFLMVAVLRRGRFPVLAVPGGRGCRSPAGVPGVRVAAVSAGRLR